MNRAIRAGLVFFASAILVPIGTVGTVLGAFLFLPLPATLPKPKPGVASSMSHVYDINGNEIATFREYETSIPIQPKDIPEVLKQAVVSIEDKRFYSHGGVDPQGTVRAMWADIRGEAIQGGSTITQQYVKNAYTGRTRSVARKIREAILASQLDRQAPKDEILYRYLSTIYLGGGAYGVGAATQTYFRKPITQLSLPEAALLAGVIRAPSYYDPRVNPDGAEERRELVLEKMLEQKRITPDQFNAAMAARVYVVGGGAPVPKTPHTDIYPPERQQTQFPYFVDYVSKYLVAKYGHEKVYRGGLRIQTSLDPNLQTLAEGAVAGALKGTKPPREMSLVSVEPQTGFVKALVGGRDFATSQVNLALGACPPPAKPESSGADTPSVPSDQPICVPGGGGGRQPGSSFKPFTLAKAFEQGITPERVFSAPTAYTYRRCTGPNCTVHNVEGEGGGAMTLRSATVHSVNTVYAQLVEQVGYKNTADMAHRLGITRVNADGTDAVTGRPFFNSIVLGSPDVAPLDMAAAYSVFAARGLQNPATPIVKIEDSTGAVLEDNTKRDPKRVLAEVIADNVTNVLQGVISSGTGTGANINRPAAGKTGTTDDFGNAWFVGYTPTLSTAVWYGNSNGEDPAHALPRGTYGGTVPASTWANFMGEALKDVPVTDFNQPAPLKPVADELDRQARGGFDAGYRRYPEQTDSGGKFEQGFPAPRVGAPPTTEAPTTTTEVPIPTSTTSTTIRRGVFG